MAQKCVSRTVKVLLTDRRSLESFQALVSSEHCPTVSSRVCRVFLGKAAPERKHIGAL